MRKIDEQILHLMTRDLGRCDNLTKTARIGGLINLLFLGMGITPLIMAKMQQGQMEAFRRGELGAISSLGGIYAGAYNRQGGLGPPTPFRSLMGLQGQGAYA